MKQDKDGVYISNEYLKFIHEEETIYLSIENIIYKSIKHNEIKHIILNIETNVLYSISWSLYWSLFQYSTKEDAKENKKTYSKFILICNYDKNEQPKQLEINKTNLKHYKMAGITTEINYIRCN